MKKYTKDEILKAAKIGIVSMAAAERIVSLLEEARKMIEIENKNIRNEKLVLIKNAD